jgi:ABC-type uncharacterized transport system ATPase subunit
MDSTVSRSTAEHGMSISYKSGVAHEQERIIALIDERVAELTNSEDKYSDHLAEELERMRTLIQA